MRTSLRTNLKWAIASTVLGVVATTSTAVLAQDLQISPAIEATNTSGKTIPEEIERAFFEHDADFFENRKIHRQISYLLGPGILVSNSFPENEIARDAKEIFAVYNAVMAAQTSAGPRIRTVDLPTPFTMSVRTMPAYVSTGPIASDPFPRPPIMPMPSPTVLADPTPAPPVPALW
jgi:hypothetical protein